MPHSTPFPTALPLRAVTAAHVHRNRNAFSEKSSDPSMHTDHCIPVRKRCLCASTDQTSLENGQHVHTGTHLYLGAEIWGDVYSLPFL